MNKEEMMPLFSIKEFSEMCGVLVSTLRYWDELGLLIPAWRNKETRYRYYSPEQIVMVKLLKLLGQLHIPLGALTEEMLRDCAMRMETEIAQLQLTRDMLQSYLSLLDEIQSVPPGKIEVRALPERPIRYIPLKNESKYDLLQHLSQAEYNAGPLGYTFRSFDALLKQPDQPVRLAVFDLNGHELRPAGDYLVGTINCAYGETGDLPRRMAKHARRNALKLHGPVYMVYLYNPTGYLLQISVGIHS